MRRCVFCGCQIDIAVWVWDEASHDLVAGCRSCGEARGLAARAGQHGEHAHLPQQTVCRCCGTALPSPESWALIVWVEDGGRLIGVCNACRVEYALHPVFTSLVGGERTQSDFPQRKSDASPAD